jgi:hypothetical protein
MWWAGYTTPARFLVAILPPLAIPAAMWFDAVRRPTSRLLAGAAMAVSVLITITVVFVDRGAMLLNFRDGASRLLVWLSPVADLTHAVPSMFQSDTGAATQSLVWLVGAAVILAIARLSVVQELERERQRLAARSPSRFRHFEAFVAPMSRRASCSSMACPRRMNRSGI